MSSSLPNKISSWTTLAHYTQCKAARGNLNVEKVIKNKSNTSLNLRQLEFFPKMGDCLSNFYLLETIRAR